MFVFLMERNPLDRIEMLFGTERFPPTTTGDTDDDEGAMFSFPVGPSMKTSNFIVGELEGLGEERRGGNR